MFESTDFFDLEQAFKELFSETEPVWTALDKLKDHLADCFVRPWPLKGISGPVERPIVIWRGELWDDLTVSATGPKGRVLAQRGGEVLEGATIILPGAYLFDDRVIIGEGTVVEPGALIKGPTVIGQNTEVRQSAYMRGDCLVGDGCVVGHSTEMKGSILLDGAKAGHFAYIGDSILGHEVNLGAGTKLANLKMIPGSVRIRHGKERFETGRRKLGAIIGDKCELGCNSVTSPGSLLGPGSIVYPGISVPTGYYPARTCFTPARDSVKIRSRG